MGISTRAAGWAAALTLAFTLTGCGPTGAEEPAELTDEQAYALGEAVYREYLGVVGRLSTDSTSSIADLERVLGGELLTSEKTAFARLRESGRTIVGFPLLANSALVELTRLSDDYEIQLGVCVDYSETQEILEDGRRQSAVSGEPTRTRTAVIRVSGPDRTARIIDHLSIGQFCG